jgi:hypothetical protein
VPVGGARTKVHGAATGRPVDGSPAAVGAGDRWLPCLEEGAGAPPFVW